MSKNIQYQGKEDPWVMFKALQDKNLCQQCVWQVALSSNAGMRKKNYLNPW